jgi:hypothetical protein
MRFFEKSIEVGNPGKARGPSICFANVANLPRWQLLNQSDTHEPELIRRPTTRSQENRKNSRTPHGELFGTPTSSPSLNKTKSRANDQSLVRSLLREDAGKSAHRHAPPQQAIAFKILLRIEERERPGHTAALTAGPNPCQKNGQIQGEPFSVCHILGPYLLRGRSACPGL